MSEAKKNIPVFNFNKNLNEGISFEFTKLEESYNPYDASHPHRHNYFEVLIFNQEGGSHEIDFKSYIIEANSIHFISPGQVHLLRRDPNVTGYVLSFTDDLFLDKSSEGMFTDTLPFFLNPTRDPVIRIEKKVQKDELQNIINCMEKEFNSSHVDKRQVMTSWISLFLLSCRRLYLIQFQIGDIVSIKNDISGKFRKLVENNYLEKRSVAEYANILNISPGHLNDTVQKELGKTASDLIHERIVLEAKRLLYHSEKSIKEIAAALKYEDPSYFTKFFKSQTKNTPEQFRNFIREKYH